jgi:hypothetical protein
MVDLEFVADATRWETACQVVAQTGENAIELRQIGVKARSRLPGLGLSAHGRVICLHVVFDL